MPRKKKTETVDQDQTPEPVIEMAKVFAVDWGHTKENIAVYDGKKFRKTIPSPKSLVESGGVIATENLPLMTAREYLDAGVKIMCLNTWDVKVERERRGLSKSHETDARVIYELYRDSPGKFRPFLIDPNIIRLRSIYSGYKDAQEERKRAKNRHFAYRDAVSWEKFRVAKSEEKRYEKLMEEEVLRWPVYTGFFRGKLGAGPASVMGLLSPIGDIDRFRTVSSLWAYFGLNVVNGEAPRRKKGEIANWHQQGGAHILGAMVTAFFAHNEQWFEKPANRDNKYVRVFLDERKKQEIRVREQFPDLKPEQHASRAYRRAVRKAMKEFLKDFFLAYKELGGCQHQADAQLLDAQAQLDSTGEMQGEGVHTPLDTHGAGDNPPASPRRLRVAPSTRPTLRTRSETSHMIDALKKRAAVRGKRKSLVGAGG